MRLFSLPINFHRCDAFSTAIIISSSLSHCRTRPRPIQCAFLSNVKASTRRRGPCPAKQRPSFLLTSLRWGRWLSMPPIALTSYSAKCATCATRGGGSWFLCERIRSRRAEMLDGPKYIYIVKKTRLGWTDWGCFLVRVKGLHFKVIDAKLFLSISFLRFLLLQIAVDIKNYHIYILNFGVNQ